MTKSIRVFIADDHAVLRAGLRLLLGAEPDIEVVGEAASAAEAVEGVRALQPDILLLDISMPETNGLTALHTLRAEAPASRIIMLTMHDDESYLREALSAGAAGYALKQAADTELLSAVRAVYQGGTYLRPAHTHLLLEGHGEAAPPAKIASDADADRLSPREQEVLRLLAMGYTNKQAADQLALSVKTVETYKARLMAKLALNSRAELVHYALQHGLMD
jgi:two-component system, NarL family, response regulator NreC